MKFVLATFTTTLDAALIEKGKRWYSEGMVQHVQNVNDCVWHADIIGPNKQFKVQVEIVGKEVDHFFCGCGPKLCSHVVALLFELVEKEYPTEQYYPGKEGKTTKEGVFKVVNSPLAKALQNINEKDLKRFITEYANNNQDFRESFLNKFGHIDIESHVARYRTIINSTTRYEVESYAMDGTRRVLKDAAKNLDAENYEVAFAACKAVLTKWAPYVYTMKHANYVFTQALDQLHDLVLCEDLPEPLDAVLFDYVFELYKSPDIKDFQDGEFWTDAFIFCASLKDDLEKAAALIDTRLEKASDFYKSGYLKHKQEIAEAIKKY